MGLFNQFIEVIEWVDDSQDTMVYRYPVMDKEIKMGAKLTVRETQVAVFINEGRVADVFGPGLFTLSTQNMPVLTELKSWPYGFKSPFKAEVYYINTKQFIDQKWGTVNPIPLRDSEFGMLRLRAFGIYSFRVTKPVLFLQQVSGTGGLFSTEGVTGQLKRVIMSGLTDLLGELRIPVLDLASNYDEISNKAKEKLKSHFEELGLSLMTFYVENISLPEEVEKMLDKRTEMGLIGNIQQYAQFQAADSIKAAAQNQGGMAGTGVGLGAGAVMGSLLSQTFSGPVQQQGRKCPECGAEYLPSAKFCPECGKSLLQQQIKCIKCGAFISRGSKFCPSCGASQAVETVCKSCGTKLEQGSKFCPDCGTKVE